MADIDTGDRVRDEDRDIDGDVQVVVPPPTGAASSSSGGPTTAAAAPDAAEVQMEQSSLSEVKEKMIPRIKEMLIESYRHYEIDVSEEEATGVARCLCALSAVDVAEIYTPPRATERAREFGLRPGFCVDLTTRRPDGEMWDLTRPEDEKVLEKLQEKETPKLLIGSPPCTDFCGLLRLRHSKEEIRARQERKPDGGKEHVRRAVRAYKRQLDAGNHFLHEHPQAAGSWQMEEVKELESDPRVFKVIGDMCVWRLAPKHGARGEFIRKRTAWLTSSEELAKTLQEKCPGTHRHVELIGGGQTAAAARYPPKLVEAILRSIKRQLEIDEDQYVQHSFAAGPVAEQSFPVEAEWFAGEDRYWDDMNGGWLDPAAVRAARKEELDWMEAREVMKAVPEKECREKQGRPLTLKWLDTMKPDGRHRSRLVVREVKKAKRPEERLDPQDVFSSMPPIEALKMLLSEVMTVDDPHGSVDVEKVVTDQIAVWDVSRAHFYGESRREVYTNLPEEMAMDGYVAKLLKTMYGTNDAANIWGETWPKHLKSKGIDVGKANRALFRSAKLKGLCHGDDFVVKGPPDALKEFEDFLAEAFDLRPVKKAGFGAGLDKVLCILNRAVTFDDEHKRITLEADRKHLDQVLRDLELVEAKTVLTPRVKHTLKEQQDIDESEVLPPKEATLYRSACMRMKYFEQDRMDISETLKCLAQHMAAPRRGHMTELKRLVRFVKGRPRELMEYALQARRGADLFVYVDSDWAGDVQSRKSTSGMIITRGKHVLRHSSTLQGPRALSSAEAEFYAQTKGAAYALGLQSFFEDWNVAVDVVMYSDSSSGLSFSSRRGLGRMRHIETRYLWLQDMVAYRALKIKKIDGKLNPADVLTKLVSEKELKKVVRMMGQVAA